MSKITLADINRAFALPPEQAFCPVGRALNSIDDAAVQAALRARVNDQSLANARLVAVFKRLGLAPIAPTKMSEHRRDLCRCPQR